MACGGHRLRALLLLAVLLGCKHEDPQIRALTEQASQTEEAAQQLRQAWSEQFRRFGLARIKNLRPGAGPMLLTGEQKLALEARVRIEKDSSRRALLREILDKDLELQALNGRLATLKAALPEPELVRPNDSHYGLALRFLKSRGLAEEQARKVLSRVPLSERLAPGFEVYHFYVHGEYGTWVSQGRASVTPGDLLRESPDQLASERDQAVANGQRLQRELGLLVNQKQQIEAEINAIQSERQSFLEGRTQLQSENAQQLARLNSLHYLIGVRDQLEAEGIIEVPLFGKDHSGRNWRDAVFTRNLDLRASTTLLIQARELGLRQISQLSVVPGSYVSGEHYRLTLSADRQTATIELLVPSRFKNDKVVFAVAE